jgi:tRNA A22 N-methylase
MSKLQEDVEKVKLEKWLKKNDTDFKNFSELLYLGDKAKLNEKMLDLAKYQQGLENLKNIDTKLQEAKAVVASCNANHKIDKLATQKRLRLVALLISERFGDPIMDMKK